MQIASSAKRTCRLLRSASEYTATVLMPRSLQAQITRTAISPRLAIRIFWNIAASTRTNSEERLTVLHGPAVFHQFRYYGAGDFRLNFIHQFHRFDDAERLSW